MTKVLVGNIGSYTFNASAKTVTLTGLPTLDIEQVLLITNVKDNNNKVIYQFDLASKGGTIAGNIISLVHDTTSMSDTDPLQIWVELDSSEAQTITKIEGNSSGNIAEVNSTNELQVVSSVRNIISTDNSTTTPLGISATYTGNWELIGDKYSTISVYVTADQDSATSGLKIEYSTDAVSVDDSDEYNFIANTSKVYSVGINLKYFRVRFVNGTTAQTTFKVQSIIHQNAIKTSSHRLGDGLSEEDDVELVKSILAGFDSTNEVFVNIGATTSKRLLVSTETPPAGPGETSVSRTQRGDFSGTTDDLYTIPSGKTLQIRSFTAGVENTGAGVNATLFEDPNGDLSVLDVIPQADIIIDGDSQQNGLTFEVVGDGTKRILMRFEQLTGGNYRTAVSWSGVLID